jgi:formylmethanofuran dehydrogenase subunit E
MNLTTHHTRLGREPFVVYELIEENYDEYRIEYATECSHCGEAFWNFDIGIEEHEEHCPHNDGRPGLSR